ncbi:MAG TPA: response regulator [Vicinamibacteria bacterium]|jgi:DNA-binding response OmpR family regulator|nr:response regulator [Vicinamibacteria bacterium]
MRAFARRRMARRMLCGLRMPLRLLVVDDEEGVREGMKQYLERCGYVIDCAARIAEAMAFLAEFRYDAVITDLQLSVDQGAEGLAVVAEARRRCSTARIVLITGHDSEWVPLAARRLGVDAVVHKPRPLPEIEEIIQSLIGGSA